MSVNVDIAGEVAVCGGSQSTRVAVAAARLVAFVGEAREGLSAPIRAGPISGEEIASRVEGVGG